MTKPSFTTNEVENCYCGRKAKWVASKTGEGACGYHYRNLPEPTWNLEELAGKKRLSA